MERVLKLQAALLSPVYFVKLFQPECALMDFVGSLPDLLVTIVGPSLFLVLLKLSDKAESLKTDQVEDYLVEGQSCVGIIEFYHDRSSQLLAGFDIRALKNQLDRCACSSSLCLLSLIFLVSH